jgi:hypothetical protein
MATQRCVVARRGVVSGAGQSASGVRPIAAEASRIQHVFVDARRDTARRTAPPPPPAVAAVQGNTVSFEGMPIGRPPDGTPMDIKTQRNLEKLFRLMDVKPVRIDPVIELRDGGLRIFVEARAMGDGRDARVALSTMRAIDAPRAGLALETLLSRWSPACTDGVPLRAFCAEDGVLVSALMPAGSNAESWYRMVKMQRRLLDGCAMEQA